MPRYKVFRYVVALVLGFIAGFVMVFAGTALSSLLFPLPEGFDLKDQKAFAGHISSLPFTAFLLTLAAHASGPFVAGLVCSAIVRRFWLPGQIGLGFAFLAGGVMTLFEFPHPLWFAVADLLLYLPAVLAGAATGSMLTARPPATIEENNNMNSSSIDAQ